ncbi:hypothetical protein GWI33_016434 [Rhynchophorus ferrugineus]|uniref:Uncharacterized protein n=1 Tax=Rhynchophorus ferrugineus TaxID=354439 RepID=A0A834I1L3_RHYFE|nr:hypothetical protein GWI33_016434 [Rhynchophorus ferrugineus]
MKQEIRIVLIRIITEQAINPRQWPRPDPIKIKYNPVEMITEPKAPNKSQSKHVIWTCYAPLSRLRVAQEEEEGTGLIKVLFPSVDTPMAWELARQRATDLVMVLIKAILEAPALSYEFF